MGMFWGMFGYMMLMHQTSGDLRETMHKLVGIMSIGTAFIRIGCIYADKLTLLPMVYGYTTMMTGMLLNFANPQFTEYWELTLGYPTMAYITLVMLFSFYLSSMTATCEQMAKVQEAEKLKMVDSVDEQVVDETTPLVDVCDVSVALE